MKKIILLLIVAVCFGNAYSQQNTFSKVLVDTSSYLYENASLPSFDGGHLIVGSLDNYPFYKGLVAKVDANGDFVWAKAFRNSPSSPELSYFAFSSIITTQDSSCLLSGHFHNLQSEKDEGVCIKMTSEGDTLWTTTLVAEDNLVLNSVCQTSDSGYVVTGNVNWYESRGSIKKLFVAKLSREGILEWSKEYTISGNRINGYKIIQTGDGNLIITGNIVGYYNKSFLLKMTATGAVLWAKEYGLDSVYENVDFQDMIETDSGFVIHSFVNGYAALIKTDTAGTVVWEKSYNIPSMPPSVWAPGLKMNLCQLNNGGFAFVTFNSFDGGIVKTDSSGNPAFFYHIILIPIDVYETNSKELFITGGGPLIGAKGIYPDPPEIGIIQVDSAGAGDECVWDQSPVSVYSDTLVVTPFNVTVADAGSSGNIGFDVYTVSIPQRNGCVDIISSTDENKIKNAIKVYPNPAAGMVTFESINDKTGRLLIFNTLGKNIINQKTENYKTTLDLSGYGAGIYYYQFIDKAGRSVGGKVVIR